MALSADARFINSLYTSILGRGVDAAGLSGWLSYLQSGGTQAGLVSLIWNSAEHRGDQVNAIYKTWFGVGASQATLNYYVNLMQNGASEVTIASMIAGSTTATSTTAFVGELYLNALGRSPSPSEIAYWLSVPVSSTTLANDIIGSLEAMDDAAQQFFQTVLGRQASAAEAANYAALLSTGSAGFTATAVAIYTSAEYAAHMNS